MLQVFGSMSTNTGVAPTWEMASVVVMKVFGTVMTSSPGLIPVAMRAKRRASVPEFTPMQNLVLPAQWQSGQKRGKKWSM